MSSTSQAPIAAASFAQTGLPNLAPAAPYSPPATRDSAPHHSPFLVNSTPLAAGSPPIYSHGQPFPNESRFAPISSPIQQHQSLYKDPLRTSVTSSHESNSNSNSNGAPQPTRPELPFAQFQNHMRPQLEADSYPADQVDSRIEEEWKKLSDENRALWEQRYLDQMTEYQQDMDTYNRTRRRATEYR